MAAGKIVTELLMTKLNWYLLVIGPRIIRFGFLNEENMFKEYADQLDEPNRMNG